MAKASGATPPTIIVSGEPPIQPMSNLGPVQVPVGKRALLFASGFSLFVSLIIAPSFMCICGYLSAVALPITVFATVLAWVPAAQSIRHSLRPRLVILAIAVIATVVLVKNVADVLWLGHHPLFGRTPANPASAVDGGITSLASSLHPWAGASNRARYARRL